MAQEVEKEQDQQTVEGRLEVEIAYRRVGVTFGASSVARHVEVIVRYAEMTVATVDAGSVLNLLFSLGRGTAAVLMAVEASAA